MKHAERAVSTFREGFAWSQAVLSSFGEEFGLDRERALRVAGAFGGGMARRGETCGAVTGALMVIGLKYGKTKTGDEEAREKTYELVEEFVKRFKSRHGSIVCRELLGYDLSLPEGRKAAYEKGLFTTLCPQFVRDAVQILEDILWHGQNQFTVSSNFVIRKTMIAWKGGTVMARRVTIYGKAGWPYTASARSAYSDAVYYDIHEDPAKLQEMLKYSKGARQVPVIVEGDKVTIGHGGTWGV